MPAFVTEVDLVLNIIRMDSKLDRKSRSMTQVIENSGAIV